MGIKLRTVPRFQVFDDNGDPLNGGKVYTYQPGTSTAKATYTDYTGDTENANPVILDARGEATIYWDGTYKVIVKDSTDVTIYTEDNYGEGEDAVLTGNFNLVKNGSFELDTNGDGDPDDWTITEYTGGAAALDTTTQVHGAQSIKFTSVGTGGGYATSAFFEVEGSKVVPVSFAIIASVATVHNQVDIIWYTAAQAVISTTTLYNDTATNPTSWTDKSYSATAPATARYAKIRLFGCKDDDAQAGSTWYDNVQAEAPTALQGWFSSINGTVTSTDEELNILDGVTATAEEINILHGVTATAAELNLLDGKVAIGALASTTAPAGSIYFDVDAAISTAWESVGPTGSGATNTWTALDSVPSGAAWVEVAFTNSAENSSGTEVSQYIYARKTGESDVTGFSTMVSLASALATGATAVAAANSARARIPIDANRRFDLYRAPTNVTTAGVTAALCGWG